MRLLCVLLLLAGPLRCWADALPLTNLATLARGFALPPLGRYALLSHGRREWTATLDLTNEFHEASYASEELRLDGETERLALSYRQGLAPGWETGLEVPLLIEGGGFMDGLITWFHSVVGQSNSNRDKYPSNQYVFRYRRNGRLVLSNTNRGVALGEIKWFAGWQATPRTALRVELKLPTGSPDHLAGNRALSEALWVDYEPAFLADLSNWSGFVSGGGGYTAAGVLLPALQRRWVAMGGAGFFYRFTPRFSLGYQLYAHSVLYRHTQIDALGSPSLIQSLALRYRIASHTDFSAAFQEDEFSGTAPDFSIHLGLRWR